MIVAGLESDGVQRKQGSSIKIGTQASAFRKTALLDYMVESCPVLTGSRVAR
jgi:hypothetical protein